MEPLVLLDQINQLKSLHLGTQPIFKEFIKNKKYKLSERWEIFCEHSEFMLDINPFILRLQKANIEYGDLYDEVVRHEIVLLKDFIELINKTHGESHCENNVDIDQLKEEILETGYSGFTYDW